MNELTPEGIRTFTAYRRADISETHDENQRNDPSEPQYEGVVFSDGKVAIRWLTAKQSVSIWESFEDMFAIHGHPEYGTEIVWHDEAQLAKVHRNREYITCPFCGDNEFGGYDKEGLKFHLSSGYCEVYNETKNV